MEYKKIMHTFTKFETLTIHKRNLLLNHQNDQQEKCEQFYEGIFVERMEGSHFVRILRAAQKN